LEAGNAVNRKELAYVFNDYSLKTVENLIIKNTDQTMAIKLLTKSWSDKITEMNSILVREGEIINIIKPLKNKKSTGYDISNKVIKHCATEISKPLTYIFITH
jgi:hypothetical protein